MKLIPDFTPRYEIKSGENIGGPYTVEGMESLVYLKKATPETLIRSVGTAEFAPLSDTPLHAILFPLRTQATLSNPASTPSRVPSEAASDRKTYRLAEVKFEKLNAAPGAQPKVEVHQILGDIRQIEVAKGFDEITIKPTKVSRRSKDFWLVLILGNVFFIGSMVLYRNPVNFVFGLGGAVFFSIALTWSMFGVMSKY